MMIDFVYLGGAALGVVGALEYLKGFFKDAPTLAWRLMLPVVCVGVAFAGDGGLYQVATNSVILLAMCQIGYDKIIAKAKA